MFPEVAHMLEGLQEGLLDRVLRVFAIVRNVFSDSQESAIVTLHEFLEGRYISTLRGMDEIQILPDRNPPNELCQVRIHIVQTP
jgi:hypothetical protein